MMEIDEDIDCIEEKLHRLDIYKDIGAARKLMKRIIAASNNGTDTSKVFPGVAKLLASNDQLVKKLSYWYISSHADNNDLILLVINTLLKDCEDSNPMTRGQAIRTLTSLPIPAVLDYCIQPISMGLVDRNPYVRRAAVNATTRIFQCRPEVIQEAGWINTLYKMIRDSDPIVVTNCLHALSVLLTHEGGIVVNRNMAHHLLNRMDSFTDYHVINIIRALRKYTPKTEDETLDIMNIMDEHLKSSSAALMAETLQYFLLLIKNMPHLKGELYKRAGLQIDQLLGSSNSELVYVLLEYIHSLLADGMDLTAQYKMFFCKYNDPLYLKVKKITLLPKLTTSANVVDILDELKMHCLDMSVSKASVRAMSSIAHIHPQYCTIAIDNFLLLLQRHPEDIAEDIFKVLQTLDSEKLENRKDAFEIIKNASLVLESDSGKAAFVCLLGQYGEAMEDAPYMLEDYITDAVSGGSMEMCVCLLTAGTKLLLKRPAEYQHMMGLLLEHCALHSDVTLKDRAQFYYHLLQTSASRSRTIMQVSGCT